MILSLTSVIFTYRKQREVLMRRLPSWSTLCVPSACSIYDLAQYASYSSPPLSGTPSPLSSILPILTSERWCWRGKHTHESSISFNEKHEREEVLVVHQCEVCQWFSKWLPPVLLRMERGLETSRWFTYHSLTFTPLLLLKRSQESAFHLSSDGEVEWEIYSVRWQPLHSPPSL